MAQLGLIRTSQPIPASGLAGAHGESLMKKTLTAFVAAATMASAIGAGVVGGLVAGAIIGNAVASARPAPVYVEPAPVYAAPVRTCLVEQQVWSPRYQAYVMRPVRVAC